MELMKLDISNLLPVSRKEALKTNSKFYFTGQACFRGHITKRFAGCGCCVECKPINKADYRKTDKYKETDKIYYNKK